MILGWALVLESNRFQGRVYGSFPEQSAPPGVILGCFWILLIVSDDFWLVTDFFWLFLVVSGCVWFFLFLSGCFSLHPVVLCVDSVKA